MNRLTGARKGCARQAWGRESRVRFGEQSSIPKTLLLGGGHTVLTHAGTGYLYAQVRK